LVSPAETIITERLHALISHGDANSRSKDVHDLSVFLPIADPDILEIAQNRCFEFRKPEQPKEVSEEIKKINTHRLEQGGETRCQRLRMHQNSNTPSMLLSKTWLDWRSPLLKGYEQ
jgi:hypothetical protein